MLITGFNLATSNYRRTRRQALLAATVVAGLTILLLVQTSIWAGFRRGGRGVAERLLQMEQEVQRHEERVRTMRASLPAETVRQSETRVAMYNKILEASSFSWIGLLLELERSVPPFVHLRTIQPNLETGQVAIQGIARSFDDLRLLLRGLEERMAFRDVYLLHQSEKKGQGGKPEGLDFAVSLLYQGRER